MSEPAPAEPRVVTLVFFGIVNAGKSSLINALAGLELRATSPIGGTTGEVAIAPWREVETEVGPYHVKLIDTPGLEEVGDATRGPLATEAALVADLVVFVAAEDLTATALAALKALRTVGKPLILAVNKMDLLNPEERSEVLASIRARLEGIIPADDVLPVSAAPLIRRKEEGRVQTIRGEPEVEEFRARLLDAITESAGDLNALNDASTAVDRHVRVREEDRGRRRARAERVADETSAALALALAINPIPLIDFLTGSGGVVILVKRVGDVYGGSLSAEAARKIATELLRGGRPVLWGSMAAVGVGGALKLVPGLGHLAGALAQGAAAGYLGHVMGRALVSYFDNGHDWGDGGIVAALDKIVASTDRRSLTRGLVGRLRAKLAERT